MKNELKPSWSKQEQAAGERQRQVWEEFFAAAASDEKSPAPPLRGGEEEREIAGIQARHEAELLRYTNVVGVAAGIRTKQGNPTGEHCLVVYVEKKVPKGKLHKNQILPTHIDGVRVDVVEIGKVEPLPL